MTLRLLLLDLSASDLLFFLFAGMVTYLEFPVIFQPLLPFLVFIAHGFSKSCLKSISNPLYNFSRTQRRSQIVEPFKGDVSFQMSKGRK